MLWPTILVGGIVWNSFGNTLSLAAEGVETFEAKVALWKMFAIFCIFPAFFCLPTKSVGFEYSRYFLLLGGVFLVMLMAKDPDFEAKTEHVETMRYFIKLFWILFAIATVIATWLAIYTYNNIDEVRSRRMLYRNSNVSLFEHAWKYTLDRFCNITVAIVTCVSWLAGIRFIVSWSQNFLEQINI